MVDARSIAVGMAWGMILSLVLVVAAMSCASAEGHGHVDKSYSPRVMERVEPAHCFFGLVVRHDTELTADDFAFTKIDHQHYIPAVVDGTWTLMPYDIVLNERNTYDGNFNEYGVSLRCDYHPHRMDIERIAIIVDDRMTSADIEGATEYELNAAGTGWLFHHGSEGAHRDAGLTVEDAVHTVFFPEIAVGYSEILSLDPRDAPYARRVKEHAAVVSAMQKVTAKAVSMHKDRLRGHYHRTPHPGGGHALTTVKDAFAAVKAAEPALWSRSATVLGRIESGIAARIAADVETRWERKERLAAKPDS